MTVEKLPTPIGGSDRVVAAEATGVLRFPNTGLSALLSRHTLWF